MVNRWALSVLLLIFSPLLFSAQPPPSGPPALASTTVAAFTYPLSSASSSSSLNASGQTVINGVDWITQSGSGNSSGRNLGAYAIRPGGEENLAFALYTFDGFSSTRPTSIDVSVVPAAITPGGEDDLPLMFWVGVSDYSEQGWKWWGPLTASQSISVNSTALYDRFCSGDNRMSVVILCDNTQGICGAEIRSCTVTALAATDPAYKATRPCYPLAGLAIQTGSQNMTVSWQHVVDPVASGVNQATAYNVYRKRNSESALTLLGTVAAPAAQFVDPVGNLPGVPAAVSGDTCTYYLQAVGPMGTSASVALSPIVIQP